MAIQDGDGPWTRIEGEGNGSTFTFDINASRGGVAWVENRSFGTHLEAPNLSEVEGWNSSWGLEIERTTE